MVNLLIDEKLRILDKRATPNPEGKRNSWEDVAAATGHSKSTVIAASKWLDNLAWDQVESLPEPIQRLRRDYLEQLPKVGDAVYQQAKLKHVGNLVCVTKELCQQLYLPAPQNGAYWVPPQRQKFSITAITTGTLPLDTRPAYQWEPQSPPANRFRILVEGDKYFPCLSAHIPGPELWSKFQDWKEEANSYFGFCSKFLEAVIEECERRTGSKLLVGHEWAQEGIFWHFTERIYIHYTYLAQELSGVAELRYESDIAQSRESGQGVVNSLSHGGAGIACHRHWDDLAIWQEVHRTLMGDKPDWTEAAEDLVTISKP